MNDTSDTTLTRGGAPMDLTALDLTDEKNEAGGMVEKEDGGENNRESMSEDTPEHRETQQSDSVVHAELLMDTREGERNEEDISLLDVIPEYVPPVVDAGSWSVGGQRGDGVVQLGGLEEVGDGGRDDVDGGRDDVDGGRDDVDGGRDDVDGARDDVDGGRDDVDGARDDIDGARDDGDGLSDVDTEIDVYSTMQEDSGDGIVELFAKEAALDGDVLVTGGRVADSSSTGTHIAAAIAGAVMMNDANQDGKGERTDHESLDEYVEQETKLSYPQYVSFTERSSRDDFEDVVARIVSNLDEIPGDATKRDADIGDTSGQQNNAGVLQEVYPEDGVIFGHEYLARCFLNEEFDPIYHQKRKDDVGSTKPMDARQRHHGVPAVIARFQGVTVVGDSEGSIYVVLHGRSGRKSTIFYLEDKEKGLLDGITSIDVTKFGGGLLIAAGCRSGTITIWETKSRVPSSKNISPVQWSLSKRIAGSHASAITCCKVISTSSSTWLFTADLHGRLVSHNLVKHLSITAQAIAGFTKQLTGHSSGQSQVIDLKWESGDTGIIAQILGCPMYSSSSNDDSSLQHDSPREQNQQKHVSENMMLLKSTKGVFICHIGAAGEVSVACCVASNGQSDMVSTTWRRGYEDSSCLVAITKGNIISLFNVRFLGDRSHSVDVVQPCVVESLWTISCSALGPFIGASFFGSTNALCVFRTFENGNENQDYIQVSILPERIYLQRTVTEDYVMENQESFLIHDWLMPCHMDVPGCLPFYSGSISPGNDQILLLTSKGIRSLHLMSWQQKVSALVSKGKLKDALAHVTRLYYTTNLNHQISNGWPAECCSDLEGLLRQGLAVLTAFVRFSISKAEKKELLASKTNFIRDIEISIDMCLLMDRMEYCYEEIAPMYKEEGHTNMWGIFLETLERKIITNSIPSNLPPSIIKSLIQYFVESNEISRIQKLIMRFDVASLDLNQLIPLCIRNQLHSAVIFIFCRAMTDFRSPAALLLSASIADNSAECRGQNMLVMKLLVFVQTCLLGEQYPPGSGADVPDRQHEMRKQIIEFLLYFQVEQIKEIVDFWDSVCGVDQTRDWSLLDHSAAPVLGYLCKNETGATLRVLQRGLSTWDALENDILSDRSDNLSSKELKTITQVAVDRVVDLLDEQEELVAGAEGLNPNTAAKLNFISDHVASNRASIEGDTVILVLRYLAQVGKGDFPACEKIFSDIVANIKDIPDQFMLSLAEEANFFQAQARILHRQKLYSESLGCLLQDDANTERPFSYFEDVVTDPALGIRIKAQFKENTIRYILKFVDIDPVKTAEMVIEHFDESHDTILQALSDNPNLQFRFLEAVVHIFHDQDIPIFSGLSSMNNAVRSKWVSVLNSKATSNLYLRLICKFKPQSVIEFLKDSESYDIDIGLASCKEFRLSTAAAYLLERKGDIMGAFSMYMEDIKEKNSNLLLYRDKELAQLVNNARDMAISMCSRFSKEMTSSRDTLKSNEMRRLWIELISVYVNSLRDARMEGKTDSKDTPGAVFLDCLETVLSKVTAFISLQVIGQDILDVFHSCKMEEVKDLVSALVKAGWYEARMTHNAESLSQRDVMSLLRNGTECLNAPIS